MSTVEVRALRLFDHYVDMPAAERETRLAALRKDDPGLHDALVALLEADVRARPLDRAPVGIVASRMQPGEDADPDPRIGTQVGAWRIVGVIGRGGMGTVYRVERADGQYQQTAALKYVRADVSSPDLVDAFREERSVLASLGHPDIVPVLDGGVDENGQPWFVMQQVDGEPIDQWCDRRKLSIRERIELFVRACDAIVHAHARGILHQDIKPSNLLVTHGGRTQLLDFGLSIPLAAAMGGRRKRLAITSGYTAPEVLRGESSGFALDVYALGVLLYQLLCGQLPVPQNSARHDPRAPSMLAGRMTSSMLVVRGVSGAQALVRRFKGELDSIALRCVETDPGNRYASVGELQQDLRNWLSGYPVAAYRDGFPYRLRCWIRRHPALSAGVAAAVLALCALGGAWMWQQSRADRERVASSHADRLLESTLGMATLSGLGDVPLTPAAMLERSEGYLRDASLQAHPDVRSRGLSVLARSWAAVGDYDKAERLAREVGTRVDGNMLLAAFNLATLAQIQNLQARHSGAEASVREGLSLLPLRLSDQHRLARVRLLGQLAAAQSGQGRSRDAFQTLSSAIAEAEKLPPSMGDAVVAQLLIQRGTWYRWRLRMAESDSDLRRAIELTEGSDPVIADDAREALVRTVRASRRPGREARSLELANALLESRRHTLGERHPQTGSAWAELAFIRLLNMDNPGAQEAVDNARSILVESLGEAHPLVARTHLAQSHIDSLAGRVESGIEQARSGLAIYRNSYGASHEHALEARFLLASLHWSLFVRNGDEGMREQALELLAEGIEDSVVAHGRVAAIHRTAYATLLANAGRRDEAARQLQQAHADAVEQYGADSQEAMHVRLAQISGLIDSDGDGDRIERESMELAASLESIETLYARAIAHTVWLEWARWLRGQRRFDEARDALAKARAEAVEAQQERWIGIADLRLKQLEEEEAASR